MSTDGDQIARFYDKQKEQHGRSATFLWLIVGGIVFYADPASRLLSWQAAVFFVVGMFVAAILFGLMGYGLTRGVTKLVIASRVPVAIIPVLGWVLFAIEAALIYFAARFAIQVLY
jgi:hypothetical protein